MSSLDKLEDKLARAVELFKKNHAERRALEKEIDELRTELKDQSKKMDALERETDRLRRDREDVKDRIERLLEQIERRN